MSMEENIDDLWEEALSLDELLLNEQDEDDEDYVDSYIPSDKELNFSGDE